MKPLRSEKPTCFVVIPWLLFDGESPVAVLDRSPHLTVVFEREERRLRVLAMERGAWFAAK